jgi:hypothetical protein
MQSRPPSIGAFQSLMHARNLNDSIHHFQRDGVLVHLPVDQTITLTIDTSAHPNVKFSQVVDVVLGIEYQADVA